MNGNVCCFFGHKTINETKELRESLTNVIEELIRDRGVDTFLFGSKSRFNSLCLDTVAELKKKYPHITRIYIRAEYPYISDEYRAYLLTFCDDTYYPERFLDAGRAVYVERNREMINKSDICIFYYDEAYTPSGRKSGTNLALDYATKKKKEIIFLP